MNIRYQVCFVAVGVCMAFTAVAQEAKSDPKRAQPGAQALAPSTAPAQAPFVADPCLPSGKGKDYQVGPGEGQLASLDLVPWDRLSAGDTVRIFHKATPYRGKFLLSGRGTAAAPIRVCGVKSASGQRPIVDGQHAVAPKGLAYGHILHETRSVIVVKPLSTEGWTAYPSHIHIDGLELRGANPANSFTDSSGATQRYDAFGACIWVERGHHVTIADNIIHDCTNGVFTKSTGDGDFAVTRHIRIAGNHIHGNGVVRDVHQHNVYTQSVNVIIEFNRIEPLRAGALGNAVKDRSAGTVVRYNYLSGGARAMDFVEAEDFHAAAAAEPAYRATHAYGNVIVKDGGTGSLIHYGGDHRGSTPGAHWGEPLFRKGTLYFYSNTVRITGRGGVLFQLSTTEERAEVWNNIFHFEPSVAHPSLRSSSEVNTAHWVPGGVVNLGRNWVSRKLADSSPWHPVRGSVTGWDKLIRGTTPPMDGASFIPLRGSAVVDGAQADLSAVAAHPVLYQLDIRSFTAQPRVSFGAGRDIGAIERVGD